MFGYSKDPYYSKTGKGFPSLILELDDGIDLPDEIKLPEDDLVLPDEIDINDDLNLPAEL